MNNIGGIVEQLKKLNDNIEIIKASSISRSFWDSNLFAALIGAGSAIFVFFLSEFYKGWKNKRKGIYELYQAIAKDGWAYDPDGLLNDGKRHIYGSNTKYADGREEIIPEKPLGEKMVIELRKNFKYWTYPKCKLTKDLLKYEKKLLKMNDVGKENFEEAKTMTELREMYKKIEEYAYEKIKESPWTIY